MQLYNGGAPGPRRVRIFMAEKGIDLPRKDLELQNNEARTPEFLEKNSLGAVPVLELDDGTVITESVAICRYLEEQHPAPALFGADALERAKVEMWNRRMELEVFNTLASVVQHSLDFFKDRLIQVPAYAEAQRETAARKFEWLDGELSDGRPYVAGEIFSVADITGMAALGIAGFIEIPIPEACTHVHRWADRMRSRPSWDA